MNRRQDYARQDADPEAVRRFDHPLDIVRAVDEARWTSRPALRRFARFAIEHPFEMAFEPVSRLSAKIGIAPSTMVRCARELGFSGYRQMRQWYLDYLRSKRLPGDGNAPSSRSAPPDPF